MHLLTANVMDLIGGSRSTTPVSLNSRKSPTTEMGVQVNQKDNRRNQNRGNQPQERRDSGRLENQNLQDNRVRTRCAGSPVPLAKIIIFSGQNQRNNYQQNRKDWVKNPNQRMTNQRPRGRGPPHQVIQPPSGFDASNE